MLRSKMVRPKLFMIRVFIIWGNSRSWTWMWTAMSHVHTDW